MSEGIERKKACLDYLRRTQRELEQEQTTNKHDEAIRVYELKCVRETADWLESLLQT